MKKLMIILAVAALAISVNARPAVVPPVYGMYEETEGFETYAAEKVLESDTPTIEDGNTYLWYSEYSGAGTVKAYGENDAKLDGAGNNYLNVETTTGTPLYRRVVATDDYWNHPDDFFRAGLYDTIGDGIYIDTYFQFTKNRLEMDILSGANTHLIVWVKANGGSDNGTPNDESDDILPSTNLIVTAANMDANGNSSPRDFVIETAANFDFGAWHRLTIRAIENITADDKVVVGFVVFVDCEQVNAVADEDVYKELMGDYYKNVNLTMEANKFFAAKQLFVGMVSPEDLPYDELIQELTAVGFGGSGKIDNLTLTRTAPQFAVEIPEPVVERKIYAELVDELSLSAPAITDLRFGEDSPTKFIRFRIEPESAANVSKMYAFLVPLNEASSNLVSTTATSEGVLIKGESTLAIGTTPQALKFLDGTDSTADLRFGIMLRTENAHTNGTEILDYEPQTLLFSVTNTPARVWGVTYNGGTPIKMGSTIKVLEWIPTTFIGQLSDDSFCDLTNGINCVWVIKSPDNYSKVVNVNADSNGVASCKYTFNGEGSIYTVSVYAHDKDWVSGDVPVFEFNVEVAPQPYIYFSSVAKGEPLDFHSIEETASVTKRYLYVNLSQAPDATCTTAKPLKIGITATQIGDGGNLVMSTTNVSFTEGVKTGGNTQRITLNELDGYAENASIWTISAKVLNDNNHSNDLGVVWNQYYTSRDFELTVNNIAPAISGFTPGNALTNSPSLYSKQEFTIYAKDCSWDITNDMQVIWTDSIGMTHELDLYQQGRDWKSTFTNEFVREKEQQVSVQLIDKDGGLSEKIVWNFFVPPAYSADPIPELSATSTAEQVAVALEGSADAKLAANIKTAAEYAAYRTWALGLEGVTPEQVKASPNAWLSYALVTDKLIEGEVTESRLKVTSFKLSGENNLFSIKLKIDDVDVGDAATVENLLKIFAIEGTKELSGDSFSVNNLALDVVQINEGEVEFVVTPREKGSSFFFRARMRDHINGVGMNSFFDSHEKVQLWEGGPYWATTNIGAEKPEDYGYYFWWGDTIGYKRENDKWVASDGSNLDFAFDWDTCLTCDKGNSTLQSEGWITADGVLAPEHDAAQKHWGGNWRMPTYQELNDLCYNKCDWTWGTMNGVNGYIVRGRGEYASNSIFLPCAGLGDEASLYSAGSHGRYWSSVPYSYSDAWYLDFDSGYHGTDCCCFRFLGQSVRPVQGFIK